MIAEGLPFLIAHGTAPIAPLFVRPSGAGSIQGQSYKAAVVEGFVALGLADRGDGRLAGDGRVESLGEVSQGIIAEAAGYSQGAGPRTH
jgi:hypothetical protein